MFSPANCLAFKISAWWPRTYCLHLYWQDIQRSEQQHYEPTFNTSSSPSCVRASGWSDPPTHSRRNFCSSPMHSLSMQVLDQSLSWRWTIMNFLSGTVQLIATLWFLALTAPSWIALGLNRSQKKAAVVLFAEVGHPRHLDQHSSKNLFSSEFNFCSGGHGCHDDATCRNGIFNYTCHCNEGFQVRAGPWFW